MLKLKKELIDYDPEDVSKPLSRNILLIGQIGAGKSSFFNSVSSIFRGKITSKACTGSFEHSLTTVFRKYAITEHKSGETLKLRLCDTRGLEEDSSVDPQDIVYILDGHVPDRYQFNPTSAMTPDSLGFIQNPKLGDVIHCVAFVVDGSTVDVMSQKILKQIKALQTRIIKKSIPQVVFLTKIDKVCPKVDEDVKHVFYSEAVRNTVDKLAEVMGLPRGHILPIKNYENETDLDSDMDLLILKALKQTINFADDYIEEQLEKKNTNDE
ncbi:interferon-induced protein 44-like [Crassostrea virginica]